MWGHASQLILLSVPHTTTEGDKRCTTISPFTSPPPATPTLPAPQASAAVARSGDTGSVATRVTSSRLVGRTAELAELEAALSDAAAGRPSLAFLAGESGVGKTRLLGELEQRARDAGARVVGGDCVDLGDGELPYAPMVAALRSLTRAGDPALDELPAPARAELGTLLPELGGASGLRPDETQTAQARVFEALLALLDRLATDGPLVLSIEDIHWADASTRAFLTFLARTLCVERILVVATYRSDELHRRHPLRPVLAELERDARARRIELPRLTREELSDQLADILGAAPRAELVERLYARSEGNPLFAEELLAAGLDGRGALPPTLRDALMVRVERLPQTAQELLRVLAVGRRLDHGLLQAASGIEGRELNDGLREAVAGQIVVTDAEGRYAFRHALLREVVDDDLLPGERAELHRALALALEQRVAETAGGAHLAAGIAYHWAGAGDRPAAFVAAVRAAEAAERVHAYGEAAALMERALELWDLVPDAAALVEMDRPALLERAASAHDEDGDSARQLALVEAAMAELDADAEPVRTAALLEDAARAQWALGRAEDSAASVERGLALLEGRGPSVERAQLLGWHARTLMLRAKYVRALEAADKALKAADEAGHADSRSRALNVMGIVLMSLGRVDEGRARLEQAIAVGREANAFYALTGAYVNLGDGLHLSGRSGEARALAREGIETLSREGVSIRWLFLLLAEIEIDLGEWRVAESRLPPRRRRPVTNTDVNADLRRAELALGRGEQARARELLEDVAGAAEGMDEPQWHGAIGALRAELERREGDLDAARAAVDAALDRIELCTDDVARLARVAAVGVSVEADAAQRARDLGEPDAEREAVTRSAALLERVRLASLTDDAEPGARPVERAWLATATAEHRRARGHDDPARWEIAAAAWEALGRPYPAAVARFRLAAAAAARGERELASAAAAQALDVAGVLGAGWLAGEIEGLAARARLTLGGREPAAPEPHAEAPAADPFGLTPRERQVLELLARGATNREIGAELFMAEKTASVHVSRILAKLDVRSRTEAAAVAHRLGLVAAT
jgi:DNA-binding CsgD family transcriptional regulator